tara:strand:+ start:115 stop:612 length:498 start_codon:yes stop_codon:yes gene_type:complete
MGSNRQEPVKYIERITATYEALGYEKYEWYQKKTPPYLVARNKPLSKCKVGMVATGGIYKSGQRAFHYKDDASYRSIPSETPLSKLRATHFAYDLEGARKDINVVFPANALKKLHEEGILGSVAENFFTCMGGIYSHRAVEKELAPNLVSRCLHEKIDVVLLVPV